MYDKDYLASDADTMPETNQKRAEETPEGDEKGKLWERNHQSIIEAINDSMGRYGALPPSVTQLARKTGLSRQTIYAHMREFRANPTQLERIRMFELYKFEVLMRLCNNALTGDFRSMKLYLQLAGAMNDENKGKKK